MNYKNILRVLGCVLVTTLPLVLLYNMALMLIEIYNKYPESRVGYHLVGTFILGLILIGIGDSNDLPIE